MQTGRFPHAFKRHHSRRFGLQVGAHLPPERNVDAVLKTRRSTTSLTLDVEPEEVLQDLFAIDGRTPTENQIRLVVEVDAVEASHQFRAAIEIDDGLDNRERLRVIRSQGELRIAVQCLHLNAALVSLLDECSQLGLAPNHARL